MIHSLTLPQTIAVGVIPPVPMCNFKPLYHENLIFNFTRHL